MDEQTERLSKWLNYTFDEVKQGVNSGELLASFSIDYNYVMGDIICPNCKKFKKDFESFQKTIRNMTKCDYEIKAMYNGVYGFNNGNLTNKKAEELAKKHPRGYDLFSKLPKEIQDNLDEVKRQLEEKETKAREEAEKRELAKSIEADKKAREDAQKAQEKANKESRISQLESKSLEWLKRKAKKEEIEGKSKKELIKKIIEKEYGIFN